VGTVTNRIAEVLEQHKKEKGWNNKDLAKELGVSQSYVSRVLRETRGKHVSIEVLNRICDKLQLTPNDLLWEED
jgi:DNA-binding Xre family transcriptional regulator